MERPIASPIASGWPFSSDAHETRPCGVANCGASQKRLGATTPRACGLSTMRDVCTTKHGACDARHQRTRRGHGVWRLTFALMRRLKQRDGLHGPRLSGRESSTFSTRGSVEVRARPGWPIVGSAQVRTREATPCRLPYVRHRLLRARTYQV